VTIRGLGVGNNGALLGADSTAVTWAGGVVLGDTTGARIGGGANGTLTVDGVISETTAGSSVLFSRAANSTTILNKVNTYTGDTQLFMGGSTITVKMGIANAISSSSRVLVSSSTTGTGFFDLNGYNQNVRAVSDTVGGDLVVTNSSATTDAELRLSTTDAQTFGGWVQDGATRKTSLVMSGSGSQSFTNINTYTGGTRIDSGTLTLGHASNTLADTGAINVNGGTLALGTNSDTVGAVTVVALLRQDQAHSLDRATMFAAARFRQDLRAQMLL
jgi:autotransporter-associated beta strand protein